MPITIWNILRAAGLGASLFLWLGVSACGSGDDSSNSVVTAPAPPNGPPKISIVSPSPGATFPPGPVAVSLVTANFSIGLQGQPHIHFFLDNDPTPYEFFSGPDEDTGVLYRGLHTHLVHWKSSTSFHIFQHPSR